MKAAVLYAPGPPDAFRYEDVPDPVPGPGEVLVRVEVVSIEGGDTLHRAFDPIANPPFVVGYQCAGPVVGLGEGATQFQEGDRVVTIGVDGSHAELRAVPEVVAWGIPDGLATDVAACIPIPFATADDCLFEFGGLQAGEVALVHAGASGVGLAAIQLAKRAGATVLATASRDDKLGRLHDYGLDHGINYTEEDFADAVRRLTEGRGADVIVDSVGGETLQRSLHCLAYRGRCVTVGDAGRGGGQPLDISTMRSQNQTLSGYFLGAEVIMGTRARDLIAARIADVAAGDLTVVIDRSYPLADAAAAHAYIESREAFGRVLLLP